MKPDELEGGLTKEPGSRAIGRFPVTEEGRRSFEDRLLKERHQFALLLHVQPSRVALFQGVAEEKRVDDSPHDGVVRVGHQSRDASEYAFEILPRKADLSCQTRRERSYDSVFLATEEASDVGTLVLEFSSSAGGSRGAASAQGEVGRSALGDQLERNHLADEGLCLESMVDVDSAESVAHQKDARAVTSFRQDPPHGGEAEASHRLRIAQLGMLVPTL